MKQFIPIFLIVTFIFTISVKSQESGDVKRAELYKHIENHGYDTTAFRLAEELFYETLDISPAKASEYGAICQQSAQIIGDSSMIAESLNLRGLSFMRQKTYFMATEAFFAAYKIYIKSNNKKAIAMTLLNIGNSYLDQDLADIGETKIKEAIKIFREIGDSIGVADALTGIGKSYLNTDNNQSISYFKQAIPIYENNNILSKKAETYNYLSLSYLNSGDSNTALDYLTKSLDIFNKIKFELKIAETYQIIGDVYYSDELYDKALQKYELARKIFTKKLSFDAIAEVTYKIAVVNYEQNNLDISLDNAQKAVEQAEMSSNPEYKSLCYELISKIYEDKEDVKEALLYGKLYQEALTEYFDQKNFQNFSAFQMNLETQSTKQEIEFLKVKSEKDRLQYLQKQSYRNYIFFTIIGILIILYLIFMFFRTRERKKANKNLQRSNKLLKTEIEEREKAELQAISEETKYKLLFRKTPIGIVQFNDNLIITDTNDRFTEILNLSSKDIQNNHLNRVFSRAVVKDISKLMNSSNDLMKTNTEIPTKKDVVFISLTIKKYSLWSNESEFSGGIIILEDFTEHKKAERYYKINILSKLKLINLLPDDLILLNKQNEIMEIHFPDNFKKQTGIATLDDIFPEKQVNIFNNQLLVANKENKNTQFFFSNGENNYLVRIIPNEESNLIVISHFEAEAQDVGIIINNDENVHTESKENYLNDLQNEIEQNLLPAYQNIQRGLSFIMIKNFAEKIIVIGRKYNNNKIKDFGNDLFEYVASFNIVKVNEQLEKFPTLVSRFMGVSSDDFNNPAND